ncbi:PiggyBac transposable element-derived protein 4 [Eumeta japonica]|uniref:PiggyBac transposable element-derived protein 4 n=1 Tax=Eumeta variegata TaxID=151549 RepID=A0A4C1ZBZ3_EUMVA|nr:PiggyBac transposable element-derived protein 4 [Eumeta japonica]
MIEIIQQWTNKKLEKLRDKYPSEQYTFKDTDQIELKGFLSVLVYSAVFKSSHESALSLFATDGTGRPIFRASVSKKRFLVLLVALRFDDFEHREARKQIDPGCAITELLDMFNKNSQKYYVPGANVTVDEMLLAFRGRCKFKMYIPSKPAKYGVKVQCLADSSSFYVYNTYVYTGKGSDSYSLSEEDKKKPIPAQAVLRLCKPIYNSNRNVTTDNWYSSIELSEELKNKGLTTVGTLKKNKAVIPKEFLPNKNKPINSSIFGFTKECTLVSFVPKKNKAVVLYSTMHHDNTVNSETQKPEIIEYYNSTKSGVDSVDQKCSVYSCSRRTHRWPMAVFFRIVDMSAWNNCVIHQNQTGIRKQTRLDYLKGLAEQLNENNLKTRLYNTRLPRQLREIISEIIKVPLLPPIDENAQDGKLPRDQRKYCHICPSRLKRKTVYLCHSCAKPVCLACTKKICVQCAAKDRE